MQEKLLALGCLILILSGNVSAQEKQFDLNASKKIVLNEGSFDLSEVLNIQDDMTLK